MENYAANIRLKDEKQLQSKNLIWFAAIHQDQKVKQGVQKGESKTGLHQHFLLLGSIITKNL